MRSGVAKLRRIPQRRIDWSTATRLIPSRFPPVELYEPIAPQSDWEALKRVEAMTNPRLRERSGAGMLLPDDRAVDQNWLVAPFAYPDPEPSQYSDGSYGVCVVADSLHSALMMSVSRREEFLRRTREAPTRLVMRVLKMPVKAQLHDLTNAPEMGESKSAREIIRQLREAKSYGALLTGPRGSKDRIAVILRPTAFKSPAVQAEHYCFVWNGERIHQIFAFKEGKVIDPKELGTSSSRTAA
jgi:hypothetical protein